MKFTKMHGCGNDYVYVDCTKQELENPNEISRFVSDRHFGIGADGLICVCSSDCADFRMAMFNADGSEGSMCGNGIRCVAKFAYDKGLTNKTTVTIETKAGIKVLDLTIGEDGKVASATVDMGVPSVVASEIPVVGLGDYVIGQRVIINDAPWDMTCVSMGNPHAIVFVENVSDMELTKIGPFFENAQYFPDRVNTEFIRVIDRNTLEMRVWERGSGETFACGTGACASVVAAYLNKKVEPECTVHLLGGDLQIRLAENGHVYMTGPATTVFEGEIAL